MKRIQTIFACSLARDDLVVVMPLKVDIDINHSFLPDTPSIEITDVSVIDEDGMDASQGYARVRGIAGDNWVEICYDHDSGSFGPNEATLVCNYLGYDIGSPNRISSGLQYSWVLHNFQCNEGQLVRRGVDFKTNLRLTAGSIWPLSFEVIPYFSLPVSFYGPLQIKVLLN